MAEFWRDSLIVITNKYFHFFIDKVIGKKINKKQLKRWKKAGEKELVRYLSKIRLSLIFIIPTSYTCKIF